MWVDGEILIDLDATLQAHLGHAARLQVNLDEGDHSYQVTTCRYRRQIGFYLLERSRIPRSEADTDGSRE